MHVKSFDQRVKIPVEIDELIDDKRYRSKYGAMICRGFKEQLLQLAQYTPVDGSQWQAPGSAQPLLRPVCQECQLGANTKVPRRTRQGPGAGGASSKEAQDGCHRLHLPASLAERWADLSQEVPHEKPGQSAAIYFTWLCRREIAEA
jgi:hypothetical protein